MLPTIEDLGADSIVVGDGAHTAGGRPLLTILVDWPEHRFAKDHTPAYYENLLFGTGPNGPVPSVAGPGGLYQQNSLGHFWFINAGVVGPFTSAADRGVMDSGQGAGRQLAAAIQAASAAGVDFTQFDVNGNATITSSELVVLVLFADPRADNLASTTAQWAYPSTPPVPGYRWFRNEGYVTVEPGPGQIALHHWYNPYRGDNYITTRPEWAGSATDATRNPDSPYQWVGVLGYLDPPTPTPPTPSPPTGKVALHSWWSAARADNFATSDPHWAGAVGHTRPGSYSWVRLEGYLADPSVTAPPGTVALNSWYADAVAPPLGGGLPVVPGCVAVNGGAQVCLDSAISAYEEASTSTLAHELGHQLGYHEEHYGGTSVNWNYSLMSGTSSGRNTQESLSHDAWYKMRQGWLRPRILTTTQDTTVELWASCLPLRDDPERPQCYLLYDPTRGPDEFFLLEYRLRRAGGPPGSRALHSWFSPSRVDNHAGTAPPWIGRPGDTTTPDYRFVRNLGFVYDEPAPGRVPIQHWWSPISNDNYLTTDPGWAGKPGAVRNGDYTWIAQLGHVQAPDLPLPGTVPIYSWWNPTDTDNYLTSDPRWAGTPGEVKGSYHFVRLAGHIQPGVDLNYDGDPWNSGHHAPPDDGLAIWHIQTQPDHTLRVIPDLLDPVHNPPQRAINLIPPDGTPGHPAPGHGLWTSLDPPAALSWWPGDAPSTSVQVLPPGPGNALIHIKLTPT